MFLLPLGVFFLLFILLFASLNGQREEAASWRETLLTTALIWGGGIVLISEVLSRLELIGQGSLSLTWGIIFLALLLLGWRKDLLGTGLRSLFDRLRGISWQGWDSFFLLCIFIYVVILFIVAWIAPPNTNDSLAYHMSRVMHWIQNRSLAHYPTPIDRQLWMPPWAEIAIMQVQILAGSDRLANFIQWFAMLLSVTSVSLVAKRLGATNSGQIFASVFCITIPMGILQASGTQNDYITALWLVCLTYLALTAHKHSLSSFEWLQVGLALGLGLLTKGTFLAFSIPFLAWLLVSSVRHNSWSWTGKYAVIVVTIILILNAGYWWRNWQTFSFPLGPRDGISYHANNTIGPGVLFSNMLRNTTLHMGTPFGIINGPLREAVTKIIGLIGQDVDDPRTTLDAYRIKFSRHEDYAGNPVHSLIVLVSMGIILIKKPLRSNRSSVLYLLVAISGFVLFSLLYKWQPTGSRLQLPLFVAWSPLAGLAFNDLKGFRIGVASILLLSGIFYLLSNPSRPIIATYNNGPNIFQSTRQELYFINSPEWMPGYLSIIARIKDMDCQEIGLKLDSHDPEYPFWAALSPSATEMRIEHIDVPAPLDRLTQTDFRPCIIICTVCSSGSYAGLNLDSTHYGGFSLYKSEIP